MISMIIKRKWAMPNTNTFAIPPIANLIARYAEKAACIVDPFARNSRIAHYRNDLNPNTKAEYHLDCLDFLRLMKEKGVMADLLFLDPPYTFHQMNEAYQGVGKKITGRESQRFYGDLRTAALGILKPRGIVISFGYNSIGMGKSRGCKILEILLVCHGRAHNDTIVTVDQLLHYKLDI